MGGQLRGMFRGGLLLAAALGLAACESTGASLPSIPGVSNLFEAKEGPPLEGKRVSVLTSDTQTSATGAVESKEPVRSSPSRNSRPSGTVTSEKDAVPANGSSPVCDTMADRRPYRAAATATLAALPPRNLAKV